MLHSTPLNEKEGFVDMAIEGASQIPKGLQKYKRRNQCSNRVGSKDSKTALLVSVWLYHMLHI